jgi:hypothetical protein
MKKNIIEIINRTEKRCSRCKTIKPLNEFYFCWKNLDKHQNNCKDCNNSKNKNNGGKRQTEYDETRALRWREILGRK